MEVLYSLLSEGISYYLNIFMNVSIGTNYVYAELYVDCHLVLINTSTPKWKGFSFKKSFCGQHGIDTRHSLVLRYFVFHVI